MSKKGKSVTATAVSSEPNPNLFFSKGEFQLPNGDVYVGEFCAHRYGLIWREGQGTYLTKDGQIYEGEWKDDKLVERQPLCIKFPTGEEYHGSILEGKYSGAGTYVMDNKMDLVCEFFDNRPSGNVVLVDINGRIWEGPARESKALLLLENSFFAGISAERGVGKSKEKEKGSKSGEGSQISEVSILSDRQLEKIIFAKSTKTADDVDFAESKWCQRYLRFLSMKRAVFKKLEAREGLTEEEAKWNAKYQKFKKDRVEKERQRKYSQRKKSTVNTSLLETFYSTEFKNSSPPIKVFYPSCDWAPDCYNMNEAEKKDKLETGDITTKEQIKLSAKDVRKSR